MPINAFKYPFIRRIATLSLGNIIGQAIPFLMMPILTRIYTPKEFGALAIFISITLILSEFVTGKYEMAILLPKEQSKAIHLTEATIGLTTIVSVFIFILIALFYNPISQVLGTTNSLGKWIYFIPLAVLLNGTYETFKDFNLRMASYNTISHSYITRAISGTFSQLFFGLSKIVSGGLIIGNIISYLTSNMNVFKKFYRARKQSSGNKVLLLKQQIKLLYQYRDFPFYSMPSAVLTATSYQIMLISLPILFTSGAAGFYLLAQRIINIPTSFLGNSIRQVYYREISEQQDDLEKIKSTTWKLFKNLLWIGIIPIFTIIMFGPFLFGLIFGKAWTIAGEYAQLLSFWYLLVFISTPISSILIVLRKQKRAFQFQAISLCLKVILLIICFNMKYDIYHTLLYFSILSGTLLSLYLVYIFALIKIPFIKATIYTISVITTSFIVFYIIKTALFNLIN